MIHCEEILGSCVMLRIKIWARPDLNRGPSPRKGDVIATKPRARLKVVKTGNI